MWPLPHAPDCRTPAPQVTSASMALELRAEVVNGPTAQGQPPFEWSGRWKDVEHRGMPRRCALVRAGQGRPGARAEGRPSSTPRAWAPHARA
jgi:hypothetical protein